jgi:hypothetical protein
VESTTSRRPRNLHKSGREQLQQDVVQKDT